MPPVRTISTAKPVKTERTHEENQERAYIAASRRSDRSLEARIESARRASEIHKKRTGRALRVTEQDVVNEEMYEEEDDDLPAQYRRLTAHLQTNSADFNRKLHAYLATHQAGRQALFDQSFMGGFGHSYPNAPHFAPQMMMHQPPYQQQMLPPQMIHRSPQSFRQAPYPSSQQAKSLPHQRSQSFAAPQDFHYPQSTAPAATSRADSLTPEQQQQQQRRMSMPAQPVRDPSLSPTATRPANPHGSIASTDGPNDSSRSPPAGFDNAQSPYTTASTPQSAHTPFTFNPGFTFNNYDSSAANMNYSPFSMALPTETQQMLGPSLDPNDPQTAMFMANSEMVPQPFYSYNPNLPAKARMQQNSQGMNQTLAPSSAPLMDINPQNLSYNTAVSYPTTSEGISTAFNPSFGFDANFQDSVRPSSMSRQASQQGSSGLITPGAEWSKFIDGALFEEMPASQ